MRPLTNNEKALISKMAERLPEPEQNQLKCDMQNATATPAADDGSRVVFEIEGYDRPVYLGQHAFNVEAKMNDSDGAELSVLLHADENGRLLELEFIRWEDGNMLVPNWDTIKLV